MYGYNAQHTSQCPYDTSKNNGTLKWKFETGSQIESSPAIAEDGTIYMGFWDDYLYAIGSKIRKGEEL
jgi:outer membrane protein assembly factor BamB